jgi:hypothetical protein
MDNGELQWTPDGISVEMMLKFCHIDPETVSKATISLGKDRFVNAEEEVKTANKNKDKNEGLSKDIPSMLAK